MKILAAFPAALMLASCAVEQNGQSGEAVTAGLSSTDLSASQDHACSKGGVAEFGRYVGTWSVQAWQFNGETGAWDPDSNATWTFVCVGEGVAVQDFWRADDGQTGVNLRTYNAETDSWEIAWAANDMDGLMRIDAKSQKDGGLVMSIVDPAPPRPTRLSFTPPIDDKFGWLMEVSTDDGDSWDSFYRMTATRVR